MEDFLEDYGFILGFLIATLFISMVFNEKVVSRLLWLILAGMVLMNVDRFKSMLSGEVT